MQQNGEKKTKKTRKIDDKMVIKMATTWRQNGDKMATKWQKNGDKNGDQNGDNMATKWQQNDDKMTTK